MTTPAPHALGLLPARLQSLRSRLRHFEARGPHADRLDSHPTVAIVGGRAAPPEALEFAFVLARALAQHGVAIVSGGARGIDRAAHEGALDVDGTTVTVVAGGADVVYPPENAAMFARIERTGALVAVQPRGTPPKRWHFLFRNSVIAALADHVVLVAASLTSGARSTAAAARRLGRPLWVVPGAPWDAHGAGCAAELVVGARALDRVRPLLLALDCRTDAVNTSPRPASPAPPYASVQAQLDLPGAARRPPPPARNASRPAERVGAISATEPRSSASLLLACTTESERAIAAVLTEGLVSLDEIALSTSTPVGALRALLLTWTVEGLVVEGPAGAFRLANR